jgi:uncharacterized OB-fold protein
MSDQFKNHVPLPVDTPAFICAGCGAVALDPNSICELQGKGKKADWCGSKSIEMPSMCKNHKHIIRYKCQNCGRVAMNAELLCKPEKLPVP